jgi:ribosomal protein L12E/L44/L45/RPP1/RPP2
MSDTEALDDFIYSLAQTIILLGPIADPRCEYAAFDICKHLNPSRISRRHPEVVYESDLETGLSDLRIRNSLKSIFPTQLQFHQNTVGRGLSKTNFFKIEFLVNPDVRAFTIDSLAAAIAGNIEAEVSKKRKKPIKAPAAAASSASSASAASPAPALPAASSQAPTDPVLAPKEVDKEAGATAFFALSAETQKLIVQKYLGKHPKDSIKSMIASNNTLPYHVHSCSALFCTILYLYAFIFVPVNIPLVQLWG